MSATQRAGAGGVLLAVGEAGLITLILLAPLPFGSVQPAALLGVIAWSAAVAALVLLRPSGPAPPFRSFWPILLPVLVLAIGAAQVVPLPAALVRILSPSSAALRSALPGTTSAAIVPLSIHAGATSEYLSRLIAFASIFFVSATLAARPRSCRRILAAIFGTGLFQAVYGSAEYLSGHQHIFSYVKRFYTDTATGTYINQNHFAGALEMALLVGLGFVLARLRRPGAVRRRESWRQRLVGMFEGEGGRTMAATMMLAVVGLGLVLSYSRSGILFGALASLAVVVIDMRVHGDRRRAVPVLVLGVVVLALISLVGWERVSSDLERQMGAGIGLEGGRARVWLDSLAILRDYRLLGTGLGTFRDIYPLYRHESVRLVYDYAHNDYIQALVETGVTGGAVLALLLGFYVRAVYRGLTRSRRTDFPLLLGAAGGVGALLLHEATDFNLQIPANAVLFAALAGALAGGLRPLSPEREDSVLLFDLGTLRRRIPA